MGDNPIRETQQDRLTAAGAALVRAQARHAPAAEIEALTDELLRLAEETAPPGGFESGNRGASAALPTAWTDPAKAPPPRAWCSVCGRFEQRGGRWWQECDEPTGWACAICHPPDHLRPEQVVMVSTYPRPAKPAEVAILAAAEAPRIAPVMPADRTPTARRPRSSMRASRPAGGQPETRRAAAKGMAMPKRKADRLKLFDLDDLTDEQRAPVEHALAGNHSAASSVAGSGKTRLLMTAAATAKSMGKTVLALAFNRSAAKTFRERGLSDAEARTMDGFCQMACVSQSIPVTVREGPAPKHGAGGGADDLRDGRPSLGEWMDRYPRDLQTAITRMVKRAISTGLTLDLSELPRVPGLKRMPLVGAITTENPHQDGEIIDEAVELWKDVMRDAGGLPRSLRAVFDQAPDKIVQQHWTNIAGAAQDTLRALVEERIAGDWMAMTYLVAVRRLPLPVLPEVLLIDEAQDLNAVQHAVIQLIAERSGCAVLIAGDPRQAIYAWRGALSDSFDRLVAKLGAEVFSVATSFRVARAIEPWARVLVPEFRCHEKNREGSVAVLHRVADLHGWQPGDIVIARKNSSLLRAMIATMNAKIPAALAPSVVTRFEDARRRLGFKASMPVNDARQSVESLLAWIKEVGEDEEEQKRDAITVEDVLAVARSAYPEAYDLKEIERWLREMCRSSGGGEDTVSPDHVNFFTVHGVKGQEQSTVWIINPHHIPMKGDVHDQERNVWYVAITRAQETLTFCYTEPPPEVEEWRSLYAPVEAKRRDGG